jgi:hypothetical protein
MFKTIQRKHIWRRLARKKAAAAPTAGVAAAGNNALHIEVND